MRTKARLAISVAIGLALVAVFIAAPGAWAEPLQNRLGQTVPTRTPTGAAPPPTVVVATPRPGATAVPPTDVPPPAGVTATPAGDPAAATTPAPAVAVGPLALVKTASQSHIWPGAQVMFTLTLINTSAASVRQVRLEDALPAGLEPGAIEGKEATWDGRTLRIERAVLPPAGRLTVVFTARVADEVPAGGVIVNQAVATAGPAAQPSSRATAAATLMLPPLELPPTGGDCSDSASVR
jgi:uncharacterized repeat protein (TIGR01451 family)